MVDRREFLKMSGGGLAAFLAGSCLMSEGELSGLFAGEAGRKPNIILVFIDDMGWGDLSCFGNREAETPHIDRLAREGIAFEQFYVNAPICSPSRVAISTGQYPQRWGITSYLSNRGDNKRRGLKNWLDPKAPMLARSLKSAGYMTGHFGKWHMGGQRDVDEAPLIKEYGFDESLTNFEGMGPKLLPLTMTPGSEEAGRIWGDAERLGGPVVWMQRSEITGGFTNAALAFINRAKRANKPFYVNLWPDDVHSPFFPPVDKWGKNKREMYLSVLEEADAQVERLFNVVREDKELRDNTLIVLCSDNGHEPGAGQAGMLKGNKGNLYEGGIRSSLIVWSPGMIGKGVAGVRNKTSVLSAIDLVPSLLKLAGADGGSGANYDGEDVLDTLLGKSQESRSEPLFFGRPPDRKDFNGEKNLPDLAVRQGRWKLLCDFDGGRAQLYDIVADPGERSDLSKGEPAVVKELVGKVLSWYKEVKAS